MTSGNLSDPSTDVYIYTEIGDQEFVMPLVLTPVTEEGETTERRLSLNEILELWSQILSPTTLNPMPSHPCQ